jgi:anti-sigma factor RsiW
MSPLRRSRVADRPLSCREVGKVLQRYLDGHVDDLTADKVAQHLEDCRRCGLELTVYEEIKASLARQSPVLSDAAVLRLRRFGEQLLGGDREPEHPDRPPCGEPD